MNKRIVIVGNAPRPAVLTKREPLDWHRLSRFIDESDCVVRFNNVRNQAEEWTGRRTDILYMRGQGKPAYEFAANKIVFNQVDAPRRVVIVIDLYDYLRPNIDRHAFTNYSEQIAAKNAFANWSILDDAVVSSARDLLQREGSPLTPSLGFTAMVDLLGDPRHADFDKYVAGFAFAGWKGHNWIIEKRIFEKWMASGAIRSLV